MIETLATNECRLVCITLFCIFPIERWLGVIETEAEELIAESGETLPDISDADDDHPVHHDPFSDL